MSKFDLIITWVECESVSIEADTYEEASKKAYQLMEQPPWDRRDTDWNLYTARDDA